MRASPARKARSNRAGRRQRAPGMRGRRLPWQARGAERTRARRREFWSCFALQDQKEGMAAFIEKRKPVIADK